MICTHPPETLRAVAARCARELHRDAYRLEAEAGELGDQVHELERVDVEAALAARVLVIDRGATARLLASVHAERRQLVGGILL